MSEDPNNQNEPGKIRRLASKFDFLSIVAAVLIVVALLSSLVTAVR